MRDIKNFSKFFLVIGCCMFSYETFAASETTKQLINKTLAKYGISAGGKDVCQTDKEPEYNENTGIVKCNREINGVKSNNYWVPNERLCKECPYGTILNKNTYQSCDEIKCQYGMEPALPQNKTCPEGYELVKITDKKCPEGFELVELNEKCPEGYERFKNN